MPKGRDKQRREPKKKPKPKLDKSAPAPVDFRHHSVTQANPPPAPVSES
jgi:hypothetical protein